MRPARRTSIVNAVLLAALFLGVFTQLRETASAAGPGVVTLTRGNSRVAAPLLQLEAIRMGRAAGAAPGGGLQDISLQRLTYDAAGRVAVQVNAQDAGALTPSLQGLGMQHVLVDRSRHLVEGYVPVASLSKLDGLAGKGLNGVLPIYRPITHAGVVNSEADFILEADRVRNTLPPGINGAGMRVGVLSDSYNFLGGAPAGVAAGELPAGVQVIEDSGESDEGRGMMELIHDIAPAAGMAFATADGGELNFANNIRRLANPSIGNCDVLVDDVGYLTEPFFQDGVVAQAVDEVVTQRGTPYFTSAGNEANQSYESTNINFAADSAGKIAGSFYDFDPGSGVDSRQSILVVNGTFEISFQWDDPFYTANGVDTDLDILLVQPGTNTIIASSQLDSIANKTPVEIVGVGGTGTLELMIRKVAGPNPGRIKYVNLGVNSAPIEYDTQSNTIVPHSGAVNCSSVAAVPYTTQDIPEDFTSIGPVTILFAPNGTPLSTAEVREKPNLAGIDGTNTSFFGGDSDGDGRPNFFGTSAAAPHVAAVAALVLQAFPTFTPADVYARLEGTATDLAPVGNDIVSGAGLVNAYDAIFGLVIPASLPFSDGLESNALSINYETHATGAARNLVTGANVPDAGLRHLTMDSAGANNGRGETILHVNAAGLVGDLTLAFRQREFADGDDPMPATFSGSGNYDGVALSADGFNWVRIVSLTGATSAPTYQSFSFNLSQIAQANGVVLSGDTRIKFNHFGNGPIPSEGLAFDQINLTVEQPPGVPVAPDSLIATAQPNGTIRLDWADRSSNEQNFEVERLVGGNFVNIGSAPINTPTFTDSGLLTNTAYTYRVRANGPSGVSGYSNQATATTYPAAPSNFTVTVPPPPAGRTRLDLAWTDNSAAPSAFRIERSDDGGGNFSEVAVTPVGATTFPAQNLTPDTTYFFRIRATNVSGNSAYSGTAQGKTLTSPPSGANSLTAVVISASQINLTWKDTSTNETGFKIERVKGPSFREGSNLVTQSVGPNIEQFQDMGLAPNTTYTYRVIATSAGGDASPSAEAGGTTSRIPPNAPGELTATPLSAASIRLNWSDASTDETGFKIERSLDGGPFLPAGSVDAGGTTYLDEQLASNTVYVYRVRATNNGTDSAPTNAATGLTFPVAARSLTVSTVSQTALKLSWTDVSDRPSGFRILRQIGGTFTEIDTVAAGDASYTDSSLSPAVSYSYQVVATNATGDAAPSNTATGKTLPLLPGAPSNLAATSVTRSAVVLTWQDHSSNETGFKIERAVGNGSFVGLGSAGVNGTTYTDGDVAPETTYRYHVRATNAAGDSNPTNVVTVTTPPNPPAAPFALSVAAVSQTSLQLTWTPGSDDATGFRVQRSTDGQNFANVGTATGADTMFTDVSLTPNTVYFYRIFASNAGGESAASNIAQGKTRANPPTAPSGLTGLYMAPQSVVLAWTDASNNETGFRIERSAGAGFSVIGTVGAGVTTYTDFSVSPSTAYSYRVKAVIDDVESTPSNTFTLTTPPPAPQAVANFSARVLSAASVLLTWDDTAGETGYRVERAVSGGPFQPAGTVAANNIGFTDTGRASNTRYLYRVIATNAGGDSAPSGTAEALTLPLSASGLTVQAVAARRLDLTWTDASAVPSAFKIERATDGVNFTGVGSTAAGTTTFQDANLAAGMTYQYRVIATNATGDAPPSAVVTGTTLPGVPAAPGNLVVTGSTRNSISLGWNASAGAVGYRVERSTGGGAFVERGTTSASPTTFTDSGLAPSTQYVYRVIAVNTGGESAPSNTATGTTQPDPPTAPTNLHVTQVTQTAVSLEWTDASTTETGFRIERSADGMNYTTAGTRGAGVTQFTDTGRTADTQYFYRVVALNGGGDSAPTNTVTARTLPLPPSAPANLQAEATSATAVTLTWTDSGPGETEYRIERKQGGGSFVQIGSTGADMLSFTDTGRTGGTQYTYRVRAFNAGGPSAYSNEASAATKVGVLRVEVSTASVRGGRGNVKITVTLTGPAPSGGVTVELASSNAAASVPARLKIKAGKTSGSVAVKTRKVGVPTNAVLAATLNDETRETTLSVRP